MNKYFPLCNYTHYSLCKGYSKPDTLVSKCAKNGYRACGIADYKSISGAISFFKACKNKDLVGDNPIKPIIGCAFDDFTLFAKNKKGWFDLIELISSMDADNNLDTKILTTICARGNLISVAYSEALSPVKDNDYYSTMPETYYVDQSEAILHRILLCVGMKTTFPKITQKLKSSDDFENRNFFELDSWYVPDQVQSIEEMYSKDCEKLDEIFNKCEEYDILSKPKLPKFPTPKGETEEEYLTELCREGWRKHILPILKAIKDEEKAKETKQVYLGRFKHESKVIKEANLFGYFLIVQDILRFINENGWLPGAGRGSVAGCLIAYMVEITMIDPIEYDLLFERFYNAGRNTGDHISYPDIDMDMPAGKREAVIAYVVDKYGREHVCQMITFGRLQGRSAISEVLRVYEACGFSETKEITKHIPDESKIADQLEEMDPDERSIIRWSLENNSKELHEFCYLTDNGDLEGTYAQYFQYAIDMEGTFKSAGKHAAGVVISAEKLHMICPMTNQKNGEDKIAALEMEALEALGLLKFDFLGLNALDKLMYIEEITEE